MSEAIIRPVIGRSGQLQPFGEGEACITQLDLLRALAVMSVCIHHWHPKWDWGGLPIDSARVQLFFALSGFLITMILLEACARSKASGGPVHFFVPLST